VALLYRKIVRDAIVAVLSAAGTGFNDRLTASAETYGITPFPLDFSSASVNFAVSHIEPADIEVCQLQAFPAACLYTTDAIDEGDPYSLSFAGKLFANVDFYVRDREGVEASTEDFFDAIEDAALSALNNPANPWPAGVLFQRKSEMQREYLIPLGDGYATRIPIRTLFEIYVN